jgi:hypothetical protein
MKYGWILLTLLVAAPAAAQSTFQSTFQVGIGYTRPAVEAIDMASLLLQAEDFLIESGVGIRTNSGVGGDTVFSWLVRGAVRPFLVGSLTGHVGGEFSLHTNSAVDNGESSTLIGLGLLTGVSTTVVNHLNLAIHVYPFAFEFGGDETVSKLLVGEFAAHLLF